MMSTDATVEAGIPQRALGFAEIKSGGKQRGSRRLSKKESGWRLVVLDPKSFGLLCSIFYVALDIFLNFVVR